MACQDGAACVGKSPSRPVNCSSEKCSVLKRLVSCRPDHRYVNYSTVVGGCAVRYTLCASVQLMLGGGDGGGEGGARRYSIRQVLMGAVIVLY